MIKGIIFDADGTLLDSMSFWDQIGTRYLKTKGIMAKPGLDKALYAMSLEDGCEYLKTQYGLSDTTGQISRDIIKIMESFYRSEAEAKPGVKEFLEQMQRKGIPMIVASSSDKAMIRLAFDKSGLTGYFADIITCSELNTDKSEPLIYLRCARIIGTEPRDTAVFEDVLHGIRTARAAGFVTVAVEDPSSADDKDEIISIADYYLADLTETDILKI